MRAVLLLLLAIGCTRNEGPAELSDPPPVEQPVVGAPGEPVEPSAPPVDGEPGTPPSGPVDGAPEEPAQPRTPAELYAQCEQRVEQPQADAECTTDADCGSAGCSGEVCTTKAMTAEVMTTCEIRPCFQVLDTCGCHDGRCTWTLKDEVPAGRRIELPAGDAPR